MRRAAALGVIVAVAVLIGAAHSAVGQSYEWRPGEGFAGTSGVVNATTAWDPDGAGPQPERLVTGGGYFYAGTATVNRIATWDGSTWEALGSGMNNTVYALAVYNGQLIAGGSFTNAGGTTCNYIARWTGSAWQPLGSGMSNTVNALLVYNGQLIAAGQFTMAGGVACSRVARWDGSTWQPLDGGVAGQVSALAIYNDQLIAGGSFTTAGGVACSNVARWDGSTWQPLDGGVTGGAVNALTVYSGQLVAAGTFTAAGGVACKFIARWDGSVWQTVGGGITGSSVYTLSVYDGQLIAGGNFTAAGGVACRYIARWDGTGWQPVGNWLTGTNFYVYSLAIYNGQLIAGGNFTSAGGVVCNYVGRWNGSVWQPLGSGMGLDTFPRVNALTVYNEQLIAGGSFTATGTTPCSNIARRDESGWQALGSGVNGSVMAVTVYNNQLIAAGAFTNAGGIACNNIARWNGSAWQPLGSGTSGTVNALAVQNGQLIAAGAFTSAGGVACKYVARWDGSAWQPLDGGMNNSVNALAVYNDQLIAAGYFTTAGTVACNRIARWDGTAWQPLDGGTNGAVNALALYNNQLVAAGAFTTAGGVTCNYVARWDGATWQPLDGGTNGAVNALTLYNGQLIAAGAFGAAGGLASTAIASWNGAAWQPMGTGLGGSSAYALAVYNGELVVGGGFATAGGKVSTYWARWGPVMPTILQQPVSQTVVQGDPAAFSVFAIGSGTLSYQWRKDGAPLADSDLVSGTTTPTLAIAAAAVADAGSYDCVVTNAAGSATSDPAGLIVKIPATIVTQPASQAVQAGQAVTFAVEAIGSDTLVYQWRKAGVALADDARVSGSTTSTLTISAVELADVDTYDVVVTNPWGTATSAAVTITVLPTILTQPISQSVIVNEPVTLSITATGSGTLSYQWRKDGAALTDGGNVSGAMTASLAINPTQTSDAGSYDVVVTSEYGEATSDVVTVTINLPPAIVTQPISQSVLIGQPVTLSVTASGSGTLSYQWRKDGVALSDDGRILGTTTSALTLNLSQTTDAGSYDVVVTSPYGTVTSDAATVTINLPPAIVTQPVGQAVKAGDPVTLSVAANGSGTLSYQWRKDGALLTDGGTVSGAATASLTIDPSQTSDAGSYDVVVSSEYGSATSDVATVAIMLPPAIGTQPVSQSVGLGQPVTLSVAATGSGSLSYQWRKDGAALADGGNVSGSTTSALTINPSQLGDAGSYDVVVSSEYGTVTSTIAAVTVTNLNTAPTVTITSPASASVQAVNTDVTLAATITDPDAGDTHTATWTIQDNYWGEQVVAGTISGNSIQNTIRLAGAGIYHITVTVTDAAGETATTSVVNNDVTMPSFVVIYDPNGGSVTGGGWIMSPAGSLELAPGVPGSAQGKATFGFVAKYHKGASLPSGNTEFQLHAGDFRFKSTQYEWLVVAGSKAQYKGWGEIRGLSGTYAFMLTAVDNSGGDKFRIKIWDEATGHVLYDNKRGQDDDADPTLISSGSIIIQK